MGRPDLVQTELDGAGGTARRHDFGWEAELSAGTGRLDVPTGTRLLTDLIDQVAKRGGGPLRWRVPQPTTEHHRIARPLGFSDERRLVQLRRPLPLPPELTTAAAIETRPFDSNRDTADWLAVNNAAFSWHPEQGDWTADDLNETTAEPWFDPAGFLVYPVIGSMQGFCWTKVHAEFEPPMGEIFVIGVHPDHHGKGLGRALVVAGLAHLSDAGITQAMLYTEAANAPAMGLYDALGFTLHHQIVVFERKVEPA